MSKSPISLEPDLSERYITADEVFEQGRTFFYKSLNSKRMIAFTGSGVSRQYKYPSWEEITYGLISWSRKELKNAAAKSRAKAARDQLGILRKEIRAETTHENKAALIPIALEICAKSVPNSKKFKKELQRLVKKRRKAPKDPLYRVFQEALGIRRLVTLNFDKSFEEYLEHSMGYRSSDFGNTKGQKLWNNSSGSQARRITLGKSSVAEIQELASGDSRYKADILHLHGHVDKPSSLVITEDDYRKNYAGDSVDQKGYREGLDYLLGSNPVMFVGVGMKERDLLQPLRRYLARTETGHHRPLFAILPLEPKTNMGSAVMRLYVQYGIFSLHYGGAAKNSAGTRMVCDYKLTGHSAIPLLLTGAYWIESLALKKIMKRNPLKNLATQLSIISNKADSKSKIEAELHRLLPYFVEPALKKQSSAIVSALYNRIPLASSTQIASDLHTFVLNKTLRNVSTAVNRWWDKWYTKARPVARSVAPVKLGEDVQVRHSIAGIDLEKIYEVSSLPEHQWQRQKRNNRKLVKLVEHQVNKQLKHNALWGPFTNWKLFEKRMASIDKIVRRNLQNPIAHNNPGGAILIENGEGGGKGVFVQQLVLYWYQSPGRSRYPNRQVLFFNASLGCEYVSSIDTVNDWLFGLLFSGINSKQANKKLKKRSLKLTSLHQQANTVPVSDQRIFRLHCLLDELTEAKVTSVRPLFVFSNAELLFNDGRPINPTTAWMFHLLCDYSSHLDILIVAKKAHCAEFFSGLSHARTEVGNARTSGRAVEKYTLPHVPFKYIAQGIKSNKSLHRKLYEDRLKEHFYAAELSKSITPTFRNSKDQKAWLQRASLTLTTNGQEDSVDVFVAMLVKQYIASLSSKSKAKYSREILRLMAFINIPLDIRAISVALDLSKSEEISAGEALAGLVRHKVVMPLRSSKTYSSSTNGQLLGHVRYNLHSAVRRYALEEQFGSMKESHRFSYFRDTISALLPNDLPTLGSINFEYLRKRMDLFLDPSIHQKTKDLDRASASLRAAMSIARSYFSVGVLSRVNTIDSSETVTAYTGGVLTEHAVRLRKIYDLARQHAKLASTASGSHRMPFYQHELVWMLNERAVVFQTQGMQYDATTCFRQALRLAEVRFQNEDVYPNNLKGSTFSVNWVRLNLAVTLIDRGRLAKARTLLDKVLTALPNIYITYQRSSPSRSDYVPKNDQVYWLTQGYLALLDHLSGKYSRACTRYEKVIRHLSALDQSRAVGIFNRHLSDVNRELGNEHNARLAVRESITAAERGGHIDVYHSARISQARLDLRFRTDDMDTCYEECIKIALDTKRYAGITGMHSLFVEAGALQADVLIRYGRLSDSISHLAKAMSAATTHGMTLRKYSTQLMQARVSRLRGDFSTSLKIAETVRLESSKRGYQIMVDKSDAEILACQVIV